MKRTSVFRMGLLAASLLIIGAVLGACGDESEPEDRVFDLTISDGKLDLDPSDIQVKQGDTVTLRIDADEHGSFHLHGYDLEVGVSPDETASMGFTADATGAFRITFHGGGEEDGEHQEEGEGEEVNIASLVVQPR